MRKLVLCPQCGSRIMDSEENVSTQTKVVRTNGPEPPTNRWPPDYYIKCWKCHSKVAFRKIKEE